MMHSMHLAPIFLCALISGISTREIMSSEEIEPWDTRGIRARDSKSLLPKALTSFTMDLYRESTRNIGAEENRVMSPLGLNILLGMVYAGTDGDTAAAMRDSMQLSSMKDHAIFRGYKGMMKSLNSQNSVQLIAANKMFIEETYPVKPSFISRIRKTFRGDVESLDFTNPQASAATINSWVEDKTKNKIKNLVSPETLNPQTKLILINAIYFKGKWEEGFLTKRRPLELPFYTNPEQGKHIMHPFMESDDGYHHAEIPELDAEAVLIPYEGDRFVMIALLPSNYSTLVDMEERIGQGFDLTTLPALIDKSRKTKVFFPKFKMESKISYVAEQILENLGLGDLISSNADLSKLTDGRNLEISDVFQKAVIEITEDGTEAAAASAVTFTRRTSRINPPTLRFNHSRYILDQQTKTNLFMYRKTN